MYGFGKIIFVITATPWTIICLTKLIGTLFRQLCGHMCVLYVFAVGVCVSVCRKSTGFWECVSVFFLSFRFCEDIHCRTALGVCIGKDNDIPKCSLLCLNLHCTPGGHRVAPPPPPLGVNTPHNPKTQPPTTLPLLFTTLSARTLHNSHVFTG